MARHKAIDKTRWLASQKKLAECWHGEEILEQELERIRRFYIPWLEDYAGKLPDSASILDIGCGPVCTARFIEQGEKTYLDPLLDNFRRAYPGKLPRGKHLAMAAENVPASDASFDLILCIDALDHMMNPELALHEMERLLKPDGVLILSLVTFPSLLVRLRYMLERFFPLFRNEANPYFYTCKGIRNTLVRHFDVTEKRRIPEPRHSNQRMPGREYAFVCRIKNGVRGCVGAGSEGKISWGPIKNR
ncbi:MAG: class I SAM-dependent methyltransferase, partial [Mariprofundaceae bacterium]|nr:class I SAM-dependent methyltransferase [Mariprofundaceae bacterium]